MKRGARSLTSGAPPDRSLKAPPTRRSFAPWPDRSKAMRVPSFEVTLFCFNGASCGDAWRPLDAVEMIAPAKPVPMNRRLLSKMCRQFDDSPLVRSRNKRVGGRFHGHPQSSTLVVGAHQVIAIWLNRSRRRPQLSAFRATGTGRGNLAIVIMKPPPSVWFALRPTRRNVLPLFLSAQRCQIEQ